jgi:hypothetical protein
MWLSLFLRLGWRTVAHRPPTCSHILCSLQLHSLQLHSVPTCLPPVGATERPIPASTTSQNRCNDEARRTVDRPYCSHAARQKRHSPPSAERLPVCLAAEAAEGAGMVQRRPARSRGMALRFAACHRTPLVATHAVRGQSRRLAQHRALRRRGELRDLATCTGNCCICPPRPQSIRWRALQSSQCD